MALHLMLLGAGSAVTIRTPKPDLASGIHGGWLVPVVGTESVGVLGALLAGGLGGSPVLLFTEALRGFLAGMTVLAWAGANWWVRIRGPTVRRRYHTAVTVTASRRMSFERRPGGLVATLLFIALVVAAMGSLGAPLITSVATTCRAALAAARRRRTDG